MNSPARQITFFFLTYSTTILYTIHTVKNDVQVGDHFTVLTFVIKNSLFKEKADLVSTGDKIVSISLQVKRLTSLT